MRVRLTAKITVLIILVLSWLFYTLMMRNEDKS